MAVFTDIDTVFPESAFYSSLNYLYSARMTELNEFSECPPLVKNHSKSEDTTSDQEDILVIL